MTIGHNDGSGAIGVRALTPDIRVRSDTRSEGLPVDSHDRHSAMGTNDPSVEDGDGRMRTL